MIRFPDREEGRERPRQRTQLGKVREAEGTGEGEPIYLELRL